MSTAYCLDFDGTLCELPVDIESVRASLTTKLAARGFTEPLRPLLATLERAVLQLEHTAAGRASLRASLHETITKAELDAASRAIFLPGVREALTQLAARGVPWGIATDNAAAAVQASFAALGATPLLAGVPVCGRGDVPHAKPAPDAIIAIAERLAGGGQPVTRLVVIGDSPRDIEAAQAAGRLLAPTEVVTCAVLGGHGDETSLRAADPDHLCASLGDALDSSLGLRGRGGAGSASG